MEKNNETNTNRWMDDRLAKLGSGGEWQPNVTRAFARFKEQRDRRGFGARKWTRAAAIVTVSILFVMALPGPRAVARRVWDGLFTTRPEKVSAAAKTLKEGQAPPDFTLKDANGADIRLSALQGKVVLLNFWATWCHGCKTEIPWFMEFAGRYNHNGLVVLGVSMDDDGWKSVKPYAADKKINYPVVIGSDSIAKQYGVETMPMTYLIDRRGRVAATHIGMVDRDKLEKEIVQFLAK